jgi:hypothetical protein
MNNADTPAMPNGIESIANGEYASVPISWPHGLTKREHFCLEMGVPDTGDTDLDKIINKGNRLKLSGLAMQGIISNHSASIGASHPKSNESIAIVSVVIADALLAKLDKVKS